MSPGSAAEDAAPTPVLGGAPSTVDVPVPGVTGATAMDGVSGVNGTDGAAVTDSRLTGVDGRSIAAAAAAIKGAELRMFNHVPVPGGALHVARWGDPGPGRPVLLAVHGITASHRAWLGLAARLTDIVLLAPDLRGRGRSGALPDGSCLARHADDLVCVLDHHEVDRAVVVGHSMGGFVAAELNRRRPDRVAGVVLADGGLPFPPIGDTPPEQALRAALGPAMARLSMTFADPGAYRDHWRAHPALAGCWGPLTEAYVDYDLTGDPPGLHSRVAAEAVRADYLDMIGPGPAQALDELGRSGLPVAFLRAPLGLLAEPPGLYPDGAVAAWAARQPALRPVELPADVNHYTVMFAEAGIAPVERAVREAFARLS